MRSHFSIATCRVASNPCNVQHNCKHGQGIFLTSSLSAMLHRKIEGLRVEWCTASLHK